MSDILVTNMPAGYEDYEGLYVYLGINEFGDHQWHHSTLWFARIGGGEYGGVLAHPQPHEFAFYTSTPLPFPFPQEGEWTGWTDESGGPGPTVTFTTGVLPDEGYYSGDAGVSGGGLRVGLGDGKGNVFASVPVELWDGASLVATVLTAEDGVATFQFLAAWRDEECTDPITYTVKPQAIGAAAGYGFVPAQVEVTPGLPPYVTSVLIQMAPGTWPTYPSPLRSFYEIARYAGTVKEYPKWKVEGAEEWNGWEWIDGTGTYTQNADGDWWYYRPGPLDAPMRLEFTSPSLNGIRLFIVGPDPTHMAALPVPLYLTARYSAETTFTVELYTMGRASAGTATFLPGSLTQVAAELLIGYLAIPSPKSVSGAVTQGGAGVAGIYVGLYQSGQLLEAAATDENGDYAFSAVAPGNYRLQLATTGYTTSPAYRDITVGASNLTGQNFAITAAPVTLAISGKVSETGSPLAGVTVNLTGAFPRSMVTEEDGLFAFTGLSAGDAYQVVPSKSGYTFSPPSRAYTPLNVSQTDQDFAATAVASTYRIRGTVGYGDGGLSGVVVTAIKGATVLTATTISGGSFAIAGAEPGVWTVVCSKAGYTFAPESLTPEVVDQDVTGQDFTASLATAPTVVITAPTHLSTVGGQVEITWTADPNVKCEVFIDGALQHTDTSNDSPYSWTWDTVGWANGTHVIRVVATDGSAQEGEDSVTVVLSQTLARAGRVLFTKQMPTVGLGEWRLNSTVRGKYGIIVPPRTEVPADPSHTYNVTLGYHVPGTSTTFADYQVVPRWRRFAFLPEAASFRVAMLATPAVTWGHWENTNYTEAAQIVPLATGGFCVLARTEPALLRGPGLSLWETLPLTTVRNAAAIPGKVLVAGDDVILAKDTDTDELSLLVNPPGIVTLDAVCSSGSTVYFAATEAAHYSVYAFSWDRTVKVGVLPAPAEYMLTYGGLLLVGCTDGQIYGRTTGGFSTLFDTGEDKIARLFWDGQVTWVGTGTGGNLYTSSPAWGLENTFASPTTVSALAYYNNYLWAAGNGYSLWRLGQTWAEWANGETEDDPLYGVTAIHDAYSDGQSLYLAAEHEDGARIYQLQIAPAGAFQCGPLPPDFAVKVVQCAYS